MTMTHIETHNELEDALRPILGTVQYVADDIHGMLNSPSFDEDYKMQWHPNLTVENINELNEAAEKLSDAFDKLKEK